MASTNPQYATLTGGVVTTLDFTAAVGTVPATVKVFTDGAVSAKVYFTADGSTPTTDGNGVWCLLGGVPGYKAITLSAGTDSTKKVKFLSSGTAWVCAEAYPAS